MAKKTTKLPIQKARKMMKQKSRKMMSIQKAGPAPKDPFGGKPKPGVAGMGGSPVGTRKIWGGIEYEKKGEGIWKPVPKGEGEAKPEETKQQKTAGQPEGAKPGKATGQQTVQNIYSKNSVLTKEQVHPDLPKGIKPLNERLDQIANDPAMPEEVKNLGAAIQLEANKQANLLTYDEALNKKVDDVISSYEAKLDMQEQKMKDQVSRNAIMNETNLDNLRELDDKAMEAKDLKSLKIIRARIEGITAIETEKEEKELQTKYNIEIQASLKQNTPKDMVKGKLLTGLNPEINKLAIGGFMKHMINSDRKDNGLPEIQDIDEYYKDVQTDIGNIMNITGIKNYTVNNTTVEAVVKGKEFSELQKDMGVIKAKLGDLTTVNATVGIRGAEKGAPELFVKFSKLGDTKLYKPYSTSAIDAADAVAKGFTSDGVVRRVIGVQNGKPVLQEMNGQTGQNARMVYAQKGKGKTEMIEGSILANLEGNPKGTYKSVIIDPSGSVFSILKTDDATLSPADKAYKAKLQNWVNEGRLTIFSENIGANPALTAGFVKGAMDFINKERGIQSGRKVALGLGNLADSQYQEQTVDIHIDEMNLLSQNMDKETQGRFYKSVGGLGNNDSRKHLMPLTVYAQKPDLAMNKKLGIGWDAVGSIGSANADSIRTCHHLHSGAGLVNAQANELAMFDVNKGDYQNYDQMVVGNVIKRGFGQIKGQDLK